MFTSLSSRTCMDKMVERSHDRSSSAESQPKFPGYSHFRRRNDNHFRCQQCRLNEGQPLCTQDRPCLVCTDWLPEAWAAQAKANAQKTRHKAAAAGKKARFRRNPCSWRDATTPFQTGQQQRVIQGKTDQDQSHEFWVLWTEVCGFCGGTAQLPRVGLPVGREVRTGREDTGPTNDRTPPDTILRGVTVDGERTSGPVQVPRAGPAPGDVPSPAVFPRRRTPCPSASSSHHRHHQSSGDQRSLSPASSRAFPDRKSPPSHHERRQESADRTGHSYVARREVQLSPKIVKPPEKRTITVISSPAGKVHLESAPEVQVPAPVMDGAAGDGPATGDGSTTGDGPATGNGPATGDGPATVDDPADVSVVESSHSWALQFDDPVESDGPARHPVDGSAGHGTPAATTAGGGPDVSMLTGTSSPLFPSIPRSINQATLVDFMSMWTLLQRQMDQASVPDTPAVQSSLPAPRHDSTLRRSATPARTPERRPRTPQRFTRTPVRQVRTPVRRARSCSESRESRSRSPVSRSSSVESSTRDGSPVNFTPALDPDAKRSISDEEDDEGDSKKISAAQYQIFRQAVTTSKGLFKVNPAKTKRASRASLLDLGDPEVTDRVSWFDQPSLQDTMVSTARIAQGLKDDEEVEKTTLSETLNTASSTFKFFTVKQMFPREPYRLKIHRDALYVPKPPGDHGFSDNKAPSSYQVSDVFRHGRVGPEVSHLRLSSGLYGGSGDRRTLSQGWTL